MKQYKVEITVQAQGHLRDIRDYIQYTLHAPSAAKNTLAALRREIHSLRYMPYKIGYTDEEPWRTRGIHRTRVKNYYVYFWIDEENRTVFVTPVVYTAREQTALLDKMEID